MRTRAAWLFLALTGLVIGYHLCLILGAPWGRLTAGGHWPGVLPLAGRALSVASIAILLLVARVVAEAAGLVRARLPGWSGRAALIWLSLGAVMNALTPSAAERALWLPVILVMLACAWAAGASDLPPQNPAPPG